MLLVVNPDNSVTVYDDPSVGDYDGEDDTLVGIVNESSSYVPAVTVTGPGSDLAGFDGDGLCSYVTCTWTAPTGYEGPGSGFTTDLTDADVAEVDFDAGGLAPGSSTYFSLEGTLTAAALSARKGGLGSYAALGDSYSAGEMGSSGTYSYNSATSTNHCHRSNAAYGPLLDTADNLGSLVFAACSGAVTADFFDPNHEGNIDVNTGVAEAAQTSVLNASTKVVTFTIGGNDIGFASVLSQCLIGRVGPKLVFPQNTSSFAGCSANKGLVSTVNSRLQALDGTGAASTPNGVPIHSLLSVIESVHQAAPTATIYVSGYPRLFGSFSGECGVGTLYQNVKSIFGFSSPAAVKVLSKDAIWLNSVADLYNQVVNDEVTRAVLEGINAVQVNPSSQFAGHRLCDSGTSWIAGVSGNVTQSNGKAVPEIDSGSFHPTVDGQEAFETAFQAAGIG